jgi:hypothetical protein
MGEQESAWACSECTYLHEGAHAAFLQCALCQFKRQEQEQPCQRPHKKQALEPPSPKKLPQKSLMDVLVKPRSDPIMRCANRSKTYVPDEELQRICPATIQRNALPKELADALLCTLMSDRESWTSCTWTVYGKQHTVPRSSAEYRFQGKNSLACPNTQPNSGGGGASVFLGTETRTRTVCEGHIVAKVAAHIRQMIRKLRPNQDPAWDPTIALGNCYNDGDSTVGFHSDFLSHLGPRPIIVGLSVGATRDFCLRKVNDSATIAIPMPHNTVVSTPRLVPQ